MSSSPSRPGRARPAAGGAGVRDRLGGLFVKAANRASEGAGRLREAAGAGLRPSIVQHAQAARERGNMEAAFWLLDEAYREDPHDRDVMLAFWNAAMALERGAAAAAAGVAIVEVCAADGDPDAAARTFVELTDSVPEARVSPAAVARMLPPLCARMAAAAEPEAAAARELARRALSHALHESEDGEPALTAGLAFHLFKDARKIDVQAARRTAEIALASPDLHEVKRQELSRFLDEVEPEPELSEPAQAPPEPAPDREEAGPEAPPEPDSEVELDVDAAFAMAVDAAAEDAGDAAPEHGCWESLASEFQEPVLEPLSHEEVADAARRIEDRHGPLSAERPALPDPSSIRVLLAEPIGFEKEALVLRLPGGRTSRVGWKEIQALSVAEISSNGRPSAVVIDCILNWRRRRHEPLRLVRLHAADFDPARFVNGAAPDLSAFLTDLFDRCQAAPLPDPESALGVRIAIFEDLASYQREVLEAGARDQST